MYIGIDDRLNNLHRHVKTVKGIDLENTEMEELKKLVKEADEKDLAPNKKLGKYLIKKTMYVHRPGSISCTVTVAKNK